jgi:hypothetical protein
MATKSIRLYELDDMPPLGQGVALGFQHILAMFVGNASVALIVATSIGITMGGNSFMAAMCNVCFWSNYSCSSFWVGACRGTFAHGNGVKFYFCCT